ncbi:MAG TPA: CaiB/BaiF CoA-transferase family protein [Anaerolineales bacterium]|nr:CaiB/BaiF CoA-transferase family protein [Anaerolineales bacterium]
MPASALSGVRVLDFSRVLAGPYCTMLLADFGAQVIKIESLEGDETRQWGPPWLEGESAYYLSVNRNKRSLTLDLKNPHARSISRRLAEKADVLVENFKAGSMARFGLDYESLCKTNPGLIYCSITGYGQTGPYQSLPGYDFIIQAEGGLMSITGPRDGTPYKVGVAIVDITAGMYASHAILAALHHREKTGEGQFIDVSLFDSQLGWLANVGQNYLVSEKAPERYGNAHANIVPYEIFETADGYLALGVGNDRQYQMLCEAIKRPDLWADERFQTNPGRVTHRHELVPLLQDVFRARSTTEWIASLTKLGIPVGPINDIPSALSHPQAIARQMVQDVKRADGLPMKMVGPVAKLSKTPAGIHAPPPRLGEHTREILEQELHLSSREIHELKEQKVVMVAASSEE